MQRISDSVSFFFDALPHFFACSLVIRNPVEIGKRELVDIASGKNSSKQRKYDFQLLFTTRLRLRGLPILMHVAPGLR